MMIAFCMDQPDEDDRVYERVFDTYLVIMVLTAMGLMLQYVDFW